MSGPYMYVPFVGMKAGGIKCSGGIPVCTKALSCEIVFYLETKAENSFWLGFWGVVVGEGEW